MDINLNDYDEIIFCDSAEQIEAELRKNPRSHLGVLTEDSAATKADNELTSRVLAKMLWQKAWNPEGLHPLVKNGLSNVYSLSKLS